MNMDVNATIINKQQKIIAYPDAIDIRPEINKERKQQTHCIGLDVNVNKTKAMALKGARMIGKNWTIGKDNVEVVQEFTYLRSKNNETNGMMQEIRYRLVKGNSVTN